jgi:hypothetical protein
VQKSYLKPSEIDIEHIEKGHLDLALVVGHEIQTWRIAAVSPGVAGLWASAIGGLGITMRSPFGLPAKLVWEKELFGLPAQGYFAVTLHYRSETMSPPVERLCAIVRETTLRKLPDLKRRKSRSQ